MDDLKPIDTDIDLSNLINDLPKGQDKPIDVKPLPVPDISSIDKKMSISWLEERWFGVKPVLSSLISIAAIFVPQVKAVDILWNIVEPENRSQLQGVMNMADTVLATTKKWYTSKTLWVNVVSIVGVVVFKDTLSAEMSVIILGAINALLRIVTKEEIVW